MRRPALAAVAAATVVLAGCGGGQEFPREPAGDGETQVPEPPVSSTRQLRQTEVHIRDGRFQPGAISVRVDNSIKVVNRDERAYRVQTEGNAAPPGALSNAEERLRGGATLQRTFTITGDVIMRIGSDRLKIGVYR